MRINPIALGGRATGYLITLQFPNWGTLSGTTDLGIYWKNPADHSQAFGFTDGFDFGKGFIYYSLDFLTFQTQNSRLGIGSSDLYDIHIFSVNAAGADIAEIGTNLNANVDGTNLVGFLLAASAGGTPFNGIRMQITFTVGSGDTTILVPQKIDCFSGAPA